MVSSPTCLASCPSRWLILVCKIPIALLGLSETNTIGYYAVLAQVLDLLQQEKRVAYRVLKRRLQLDDELLEDLKDNLIYAKKGRSIYSSLSKVKVGGHGNA